MAFEQLTEQEQNTVRQCMEAVLNSDEIEDPEFHTRLGIDRSQLRKVLASWPHLDDAEDNSDTCLAINNCMNEVAHGIYISPKDWARWFTSPKEDVKSTYKHWARFKIKRLSPDRYPVVEANDMASTLEKAKTAKQTPVQTMTYEEFLDWADEDTYAEWVDGKVELMSPASVKHQDVSGFLASLLRFYAEDNAAGRIFAAPFPNAAVECAARARTGLAVCLAANTGRLRSSYLDGPADLAIEIVSPESALRDRGAKYAEYEAGGVREYWIIDADARRADFFVLDAEGRYQRASPAADGKYASAVLPGFWVNIGWLWQNPLPPVRQVLSEWEAGSSH